MCPSGPIGALRANPECEGGTRAPVEIDTSQVRRTDRENRHRHRASGTGSNGCRVGDCAKAHGLTRPGFPAQAAERAIG